MAEAGPEEAALLHGLEATNFRLFIIGDGSAGVQRETEAVMLAGMRTRSLRWWDQLRANLLDAGYLADKRGEIITQLRYDRIISDMTTLAFARAADSSGSLPQLALRMHPKNRLLVSEDGHWSDSLRRANFELSYDRFKLEPTVHHLWLLWLEWAKEELQVQGLSRETDGVDGGAHRLSFHIGNALYCPELELAMNRIRSIIEARILSLRGARSPAQEHNTSFNFGQLGLLSQGGQTGSIHAPGLQASAPHIAIADNRQLTLTDNSTHSSNLVITGGQFLTVASDSRIDPAVLWSFSATRLLTEAEAKSLSQEEEREKHNARADFNSNLGAAAFQQRMQDRIRAVVLLKRVPVLKLDTLKSGLASLTQDDVDNATELAAGTGFLISPQLLLTCHHVLPHRLVAEYADIAVVFDFDTADQRGVQHGSLRPADFFWTDPVLDVTVVAFSLPEGDTVPRLPIVLSRGSCSQQLTKDGRLCILGHPKAEYKQASMREGALKQTAHCLTYSNDAFPGNSGSPVFTMHWEAVAIHVCGLTYPSRPLSHVTLNEGTFTSAVVNKLTERYKEMLPLQADSALIREQLVLLREFLLQDHLLLHNLRKQMLEAQAQALA